MGWRYIASRLNGDGTEEFLDFNVPFTGVDFTDVLSGPADFAATLSPEYLGFQTGKPLVPWSTAVYVECDGEIRGGVIIDDVDIEGSQLSVTGVGFSGYAKDIPYTGFWTRTKVDPLDVAREAWRDVQSHAQGNIGLQLDATTSNARIGTDAEPIVLAWWQTQDCAGIVDSMAQYGPYAYRERHSWSGDSIVHRLEFGVPTLGSRRDDLRFVVGENITAIPKFSRSGTTGQYASEVLMIGAGEGAKAISASVVRPDTRLRRVAVLNNKSLTTKTGATGAARRELIFRQSLDDVNEIRVREHDNAPLGSYSVGDDIYVQGAFGWASDIALWCRVMAIKISPDSPDVATLTLSRVDRITA